MKKGGATLLFLDPFPYDNPSIAPEVPKQPPGGMFGGGQPPEPKGNLSGLLDACGIDWPANEIVWNVYNPHPKMADLQATPEIVFIGTGSGALGCVQRRAERERGLAGDRDAFRRVAQVAGGGIGARVHSAVADGADRRDGFLVRFRDAGVHGILGSQSAAPAYAQ